MRCTLNPPASNTSRTDCLPAASVTGTPTVVQTCQPPVRGTVTTPVMFVEPARTWSAPPPSGDATRMFRTYLPATATDTVYCNHSPAPIHPTLWPPSDDGSMSTSVVRSAPPLLPALSS
jgi:hypothetical protein